jgi:hypothetical protein
MITFQPDNCRPRPFADDLLPVKNLPPNRGFLRPPQYADRAYQLCGLGLGQDKYAKIFGNFNEDQGHRMLMKQRLYKEPYYTQGQISSTPGYRSKDLTSGRNLKARKS